MTREDKVKAFTMRLDGATYQAIADEFGVTRQNIEQMLKVNPRKKCKSNANKCIYKGLGHYIESERMTLTKLSEMLGFSGAHSRTITGKLSGKRDFKLSEIRKILEVTGMTFEECFELKESQTDRGR